MNTQVNEAWQVGLSVLQPTGIELEHGLGLHKRSLVIESYGLGIRSAINGDVLAKLIEQGGSNQEVIAAYADMSLSGMAKDPASKKEYQQVFDFAGVDCISQNAGEESQAPLQMIKCLASLTFVTDMLGDIVQRASRPDDIVDA